MVEKGFIRPERKSDRRPMEQFSRLAHYSVKYIQDISNFPETYTEEEKQAFHSECEKYGYYYNCISSAMNSKNLPLMVLSGNWERYIKHITVMPVMVSNRSEHFQYMQYTARCIVCCNKLPDNEYECIDLPVYILDYHTQYIWSQINTPNPKTTIDILTFLLSKGYRWKRQITIK